MDEYLAARARFLEDQYYLCCEPALIYYYGDGGLEFCIAERKRRGLTAPMLITTTRKSIIPDTTTKADQPVSGGHSHGQSVDNSDQHNHHDRPSAGKN